MARVPSLSSVSRALMYSLGSAANLYASVEDFCAWTYDGMTSNALHPAQARRVVALSFLAAVASWEEFIEASFVRYLAGAASASGRRPHLKFGPAASIDDAYAVISGKPGFDPARNYLSWTVDDTLRRASLFFGGGDPFNRSLSPVKEALDDAAIIRNRVAHASQKSRSAFRGVATKIRGSKLRQGYSVGDLLLESARPVGVPDAPGAVLFERYINFFASLATDIAD